MEFFDTKATCGYCQRECGLHRFRIRRSEVWLCPDCLKRAGGMTGVNLMQVTLEEIHEIISAKEQKAAEEHCNEAPSRNPPEEAEDACTAPEASVQAEPAAAPHKQPAVRKQDKSPPSLRTAKELYFWAKHNGYGRGSSDNWGIKHFRVIEQSLMPGEQVLLPFVGFLNRRSAADHQGIFAFALTNKRFILAQKKTLAGAALHTVYLEHITGITFRSGFFMGTMTVESLQGAFSVSTDGFSAQRITGQVHKVLDSLKRSPDIR